MGKRVKSSKTVKINNASVLWRMSLFNNGSNILITDYSKGVIHKLDINLNYIEAINPNNRLKQPWGICVQRNQNETIFVADYKLKKVFMFDSTFKFIKSIGDDLNACNLSIDSDSLLVSEYKGDVLSIYNIENGNVIKKIKVERPLHSTNDINNIYVVSRADVDYDLKRKLNKIIEGNSIIIISKSTLEITGKIQFNDWLWLRSIHSSNDQIYTIAHELDDNSIWSENYFLFQINKENKQITKKIELKDINNFRDAIYLNNKVILCWVNGKDNEIRTIEFH